MTNENKLTESDVVKAQEAWGQAVATADVDALMKLYATEAVLKPTLSNAIRKNHEDIKAYFLGSQKFDDPGFLKRGICKVEFLERNILLLESGARDTGIYKFTDDKGGETKAHYTFVYDSSALILTQHSSLLT